jgi:hypothetical protein
MVHAANGTPKHESQLCQLFSALLCSISRTYQENVVTCRDMCKAVSNPSMTHAHPDSPGLHGLPTIAKEITEGLTLDWTHGRNMKELIVLNEFQWYTMIYDWLILAAWFACSFCMRMSSILEPKKNCSSQKSHSYRLVSPASRNRDNASIWTDPWHEQGMNEYNTNNKYIYIHTWYCTYDTHRNTKFAKTRHRINSWPLTPGKNQQTHDKDKHE